MPSKLSCACWSLLAAVCLAAGPGFSPVFASTPLSAYTGHPKLVVIVIIDQFRADYLERYRADFVAGGFNLFLEHGAVFTDCQYGYASTRTAPGHATLLTGAYSDGHGFAVGARFAAAGARLYGLQRSGKHRNFA